MFWVIEQEPCKGDLRGFVDVICNYGLHMLRVPCRSHANLSQISSKIVVQDRPNGRLEVACTLTSFFCDSPRSGTSCHFPGWRGIGPSHQALAIHWPANLSAPGTFRHPLCSRLLLSRFLTNLLQRRPIPVHRGTWILFAFCQYYQNDCMIKFPTPPMCRLRARNDSNGDFRVHHTREECYLKRRKINSIYTMHE